MLCTTISSALNTTKCTQRLRGIVTFLRRAQHIQDMFWLTHQVTIIYSKMKTQYISILHGPKLGMEIEGNHFSDRFK